MKSRTFNLVISIAAVFVAVTVPCMTAQEQDAQHTKGHHRYKFVDLTGDSALGKDGRHSPSKQLQEEEEYTS